MNFCFKERGKAILSTEVNRAVLDEVRKERKIKMALGDLNEVEKYISLEITTLEMSLDDGKNEDASPDVKKAIFEKVLFRRQLANKISITRLDYMIRVLRLHFKKAQISDPDAFKDRIKVMERQDAVNNLRRIKSTSSLRSSVFNRSAKTGLTDKTGDDDETLMDAEDAENTTNNTRGIASDPLMLGLNEVFEMMQENIENNATDRIALLNKMSRKKKAGTKEDPLDNDDRRLVNKNDFNFQE
jgi:hypothetical protein